MKLPVQCPLCGEKGIASEEQFRKGISCPTCQQHFIPPKPSFLQRQLANRMIPVAMVVLFILAGWLLGWISFDTMAVLFIIGLLAAIVDQLVIANNKR